MTTLIYRGTDPYVKCLVQDWTGREFTEPQFLIFDDAQRHILHKMPEKPPKGLLLWASGRTRQWVGRHWRESGYAYKECVAAYHWEQMMLKHPKERWREGYLQIKTWEEARRMTDV